MKIALAGNPNSGKTTLFNAITGKMEYVGNWPGVTVEKKEGILKRNYKTFCNETGKGCSGEGRGRNRITVVDLPGAYSISPFTGEEAITRDFILGENPDVIINIIDSSSLERSLFFTTQLLEINVPVIIALNKQDIVKRSGNKIDINGLSKALQCEIVEITANTGEGLKELTTKAIEAAEKKSQIAPYFEGKGTEGENRARQTYIKAIINKYFIKNKNSNRITFSDKIDRVLANGFFGIVIFGLIMWAVYTFSITGFGGLVSEYINETLFAEVIPNFVNSFLENIGVNPLLQALIVDGAIGGMGAVLGFIPLIMTLFFCLALLEDSGYMARVAVIMDRYFKKIGLSGKSIIPMIVGTGCSIPGVMAARTIEDENEKISTIMLTPFVPCGAKLPIIALFASVFFPGQAWVFPSMYLIAGILIIVGGLLLKKIFKFESRTAFIIELPEYKIPSLKHAFKQMLNQAKAFIIKASTIILVMNTLVWFLQTYGWNLKVVDEQSASILAHIGNGVAPLLIPLGFIGWQMGASILTGFIAKENVVATFAIVLMASEEALYAPGGELTSLFTPVTAFAFILFNLFTPPCFAAIGAMNSELGGRKWLSRAILFQLSAGYTLAMLVNQVGTFIVYGRLADGFIASVIISILLVGFLYYAINRNHKEIVSNHENLLGGESGL